MRRHWEYVREQDDQKWSKRKRKQVEVVEIKDVIAEI